MIQFFEPLLREMPVLTVFTSQVATRTGEAEPKMAGDEMVDGSFLNGADIDDGRIAIDEGI